MDLHETILDACVRHERFIAAPPGVLRIERGGDGVRRVFLDRPGVPNDRPVVEARVERGAIVVRRNVAMRGGTWIEEHTGTCPPDERLLARCLEMALVGTSRLPITSVETPLPLFTLGLLAYEPAGDGLDAAARRLEIALRMSRPIEVGGPIAPVVKVMFNHLALSPYTCLVDNLVALLSRTDPADAADAIGYMLRHLARHLNAFDLVRFHNRGANYPDALMLDALLRAVAPLLERHETPALRRGLLHGWLARRRCENLLVPDHPTSPGEASRALPADYAACDPDARTRELFCDDPAEALLTPHAKDALRRAAAEAEPREFGAATFLDRPLGVMKRGGEEDRTPLLSYEAFSRRLAQRRIAELASLGLPMPPPLPQHVAGFPVGRLPGHARDGVVSLEDAKKVALDFVFTRATRSSLAALRRDYALPAVEVALLIRTGRSMMTAFDDAGGASYTIDLGGASYREIAGADVVDGLRVTFTSGEALSLPPGRM